MRRFVIFSLSFFLWACGAGPDRSKEIYSAQNCGSGTSNNHLMSLGDRNASLLNTMFVSDSSGRIASTAIGTTSFTTLVDLATVGNTFIDINNAGTRILAANGTTLRLVNASTGAVLASTATPMLSLSGIQFVPGSDTTAYVVGTDDGGANTEVHSIDVSDAALTGTQLGGDITGLPRDLAVGSSTALVVGITGDSLVSINTTTGAQTTLVTGLGTIRAMTAKNGTTFFDVILPNLQERNFSDGAVVNTVALGGAALTDMRIGFLGGCDQLLIADGDTLPGTLRAYNATTGALVVSVANTFSAGGTFTRGVTRRNAGI